MQLRHSLLLALPLLACSSVSFAALEGGCAKKAQDIQTQIDYANQHGNTHRVAGLKTALSEVQANCTESGLQAERQQDIKDKQHKVSERQRELAEAEQKGDKDKIAKKQKKLAEAQEELQQAQAK